MERSEKSDTEKPAICDMIGATGRATITYTAHPILISVVERSYTTLQGGTHSGSYGRSQDAAMAFVRRKGNAYYLVHNVRRGGKVRQLHLARLGDRARITEQVVREVSKKHPFVDLNWRAIREQANEQVDLANPNSPALQKLVAN